MKRIVLVTAALAAGAALAQSPTAYRSMAPVMAVPGQSLQRLALPLEAYRDARADLGDVRVFNGRGEPVPIAFAAEAPSQPPAPETVALRAFPLEPAGTAAAKDAGTKVAVTLPDGTRVQVRGDGKAVPAPARKTVSWLLDAGEGARPVKAITFEWRDGPGTQMPRLRIEASGDLKAWTPVATAPLARLEHEGQRIVQPRVEFAARGERYLLVTVVSGAFDLVSATGEHVPLTPPPRGMTREVEGQPGERPGEFVYDLGAALPVRAVALVPKSDNVVLVATFGVRAEPREAWREVLTGTFYRLAREGGVVTSPPQDANVRAARYWRVRLAPGSSAGPAPKLQVTWTPAQVVFVAQEPAPFTLAFGREKSTAVALPVASLLPSYKPQDEWKLPEATVGAVQTGEPVESLAERVFGEVSPKRVGLWVVLLVGVGLLGVMAWRLGRAPK